MTDTPTSASASSNEQTRTAHPRKGRRAALERHGRRSRALKLAALATLATLVAAAALKKQLNS